MGAFNTNFWTWLVIANGTLTARPYINEILQPVVVLELRCHRQLNQLSFQHDNACAHTIRFTRDFLNLNGVDVLE